MKANDRIYVSEYLKDLNKKVEYAVSFQHLNKAYNCPLTCKDLAAKCGVTPATISNLTTSSNFFLLHRVSEEILDAYYGYFNLEESLAIGESSNELISPRDVNYVLMTLTTFYTDSWLYS